MEKVFNYGPWEDQLSIMRYYGLERIKKEIPDAGYLRPAALSFLSLILGVPKNDFKCYIKMQSHPLPWVY